MHHHAHLLVELHFAERLSVQAGDFGMGDARPACPIAQRCNTGLELVRTHEGRQMRRRLAPGGGLANGLRHFDAGAASELLGVHLLTHCAHVKLGDFARRAARSHIAAIQIDRPLAQALDRAGVMADEQHAGARLLQSGHGAHALGLKVHVAHRQRLIHDHDVRLGNDVHRERQAHIHPARIGLDRLLDEVADVGKGGNVIEACRRFLGAQAQQGATQADIFTAGEVGVEARAQFQ